VKRQVTVVSEAGTQAGERPKEGKPLKVIVAGGGVGGLTCAFSMLKQGWDVRVFETQLKLGESITDQKSSQKE
jgi:monoamine oxidase